MMATRMARSVGWLYGLNTLGAAMGCAVCGFWMIRFVGVNRTLYLCALVNLLIGFLLWRLPLVPAEDQSKEKRHDVLPQPKDAGDRTACSTLMASLFFLTGFVSLGHEVLWTRYTSLLIHNTVYTHHLEVISNYAAGIIS